MDSLDIETMSLNKGFECKILFYEDELFYCNRDILKCLNYSKDIYRNCNKNIIKNK